MNADMNLLEFFLILAFMGAIQSMFALITAIIVNKVTFIWISRGGQYGR